MDIANVILGYHNEQWTHSVRYILYHLSSPAEENTQFSEVCFCFSTLSLHWEETIEHTCVCVWQRRWSSNPASPPPGYYQRNPTKCDCVPRTSTHKIYFDSKVLLIFLGIGDVLFLVEVAIERRIVWHEYECARNKNNNNINECCTRCKQELNSIHAIRTWMCERRKQNKNKLLRKKNALLNEFHGTRRIDSAKCVS